MQYRKLQNMADTNIYVPRVSLSHPPLQTPSLIQRTCAWANSGRWWRTRKPDVLLQSMGSQCVRHNLVTKQHQNVYVPRVNLSHTAPLPPPPTHIPYTQSLLETLQDQIIAFGPTRLLLFSWVLVGMRFCVHLLGVKSLFPPVLWDFQK